MKKLLIGLLALGSFSAFSAGDCRDVFSSFKTRHLYDRVLSSDNDTQAIMTFAIGSMVVGGAVEAGGNFGTTAALGSTLGIASAFAPAIVLLGIEGGIAIANSPYTKAVNLIDQSYLYKQSKYARKTRLLKRTARRLSLSPEDLSATIIRSNEDGTLCENNLTKKDIVESVRKGIIKVIDVQESNYSGEELKWTCKATGKHKKTYGYYGTGSRISNAKREARDLCQKENNVKCIVKTCTNNYEDLELQYYRI